MNAILQDTSTLAMIAAIEANPCALFVLMRAWPKAQVQDESDLLWTITDVPFPLFNSVLRANLTPDNAETAIQAAIARCEARQVPMLWWVGPSSRPANLGERLLAHRFILENETPAMGVDLLKLNENLEVPAAFTIEEVHNLEMFNIWHQTFASGYEIPDFVADAFFDSSVTIGFGPDRSIRHWIGRLDGEAVATSSLIIGAGVAGIYNVATIRAARRQGIGAAITLAPLRAARQMGYRIGVLQASTLGFNIYRKLGFVEYFKFGHYLWTNDAS
jgi:ribosomal protein S18 acetylase RimI-like enzyme